MQWLIDILFGMVANYLDGMIVLWSGDPANIQTGWQLCDGTNGTPDLRDRFIVCAHNWDVTDWRTDITFPPSTSGGDVDHVHGFTGVGHGHPSQAAVAVSPGSGEIVWDDAGAGHNTGIQAATGETESLAGISVPYYALAYIMKI